MMHAKVIEDSVFGADRLPVDDTLFKNCTFTQTILTYSGGEPAIFDGCKFNSVTWSIEGNAGNTIGFLYGLYNSPFRPVAEAMVQKITSGKKAVSS